MEYLYTDKIRFSENLEAVFDLSLFSASLVPELHRYCCSYLVKMIKISTVGTIGAYFKDQQDCSISQNGYRACKKSILSHLDYF